MRRFVRENIGLVAAGLGGVVVFASLFHAAFMGGVRPQPLGISAITDRAADFARLEGWQVTSLRARTLPVEGDEWAIVRRQAAARGEPVPPRESIADPQWETSIVTNPSSIASAVTTFKPPDPILNIETTPEGVVVKYIEVTTQLAPAPVASAQQNRQMPFRELNIDRLFEVPSETRQALKPEQLQAVLATARDFFDRHAIVVAGDPAAAFGFEREEHELVAFLVWQRPGPVGTEDVARVAVANGRVAAYDRNLRVPGEQAATPENGILNTILEALPGIVVMLSGALVAVAVLIRRRQGELEGRSATALFVAYLLLSSLLTIGSLAFLLSLMGSMAGFVFSWVYIIQFVVFIPLGTMLMSLMMAGCWAAGESQAYLAWQRHIIRPFSALLRGNVRAPGTAGPVAVGYCVAFAALGTVTAFGLILPANAVPSVAALSGLYYWPPSVMPALQGLSMALSTTLACGIFAMTYVRIKAKRLWIVVLVGTIVFVSIRNQMTGFQMFPVGTSTSVALFLVFGLCVSIVFVKYGPVASFTTMYVYVVAVTAYPIALTGNAEHIRIGLWSLGLMLAPAAVAMSSVLWPRSDDGARVPTHVRRALDRLRLGEEFQVARNVQSRLLPERAPSIDGLDIAGVCVPANEVGGDYFDYFPMADGRIGVAVGDVSGKGVGAAIYMTLTKSYMVTQAVAALDPASVLGRVNTHLRKNLSRGTFVTMAYAVLDPPSRTLAYTRAGHNPPLLLKRDGEGDFLSAAGIALGCAGTSTFRATTRSETVSVEPGDLILLYTDGVTEAMDLNSGEYGEERLVTLAKRLAATGAPAAAVIDAILGDVHAFAGRAPQHDDITLVAIRVVDRS